ncbi:MAG: hypothetical protein EA399_18340, partial [Desulfovibrionales bacterium]
MKSMTTSCRAVFQRLVTATVTLCICFWAGLALGQGIDPDHRFAWSENTGWQNWHSPPHGQVAVYTSHLEGYVWAENIGWIRLGTHTGGGTHTYANTDETNYGVNRTGNQLSGFAWGENIGWINFGPSAHHTGVQIDPATGDFSGYAWGENIGWVSFAGTAQDNSAYKVKLADTAPTVTTQAATNIGTTTATGNGNITDLGIPNPMAHGVCWSTTENPTTNDTCDDRGTASATGGFTANITGLTSGTTYNVRAFATNAGGTGYGANETFTTLATYPVTYNANNATSGTAPSNQTKTQGIDLNLASNTGNLARDGFTFAGWNTAADGTGTDYGEGATYTVDAALTLYAKWIGDFAGGDGTQISPYLIMIPAHLNNVRYMDHGEFFRLEADLDLNGWNSDAGWTPIGTESDPFNGFFDGNDHLIVNLSIEGQDTDNIGLFGVVGAQGSITDIVLSNVVVTGRNNVGALAGFNTGLISRNHAFGTISGGGNVGGLVGLNQGGTIRECYAAMDVFSFAEAGGLVGSSVAGTIEDSFAQGPVGGMKGSAGLVGVLDFGSVSRSYASGLIVTDASGQDFGGLIGRSNNDPAVTHSYWDTQRSGQTDSAAGTGLTTEEMRDSTSYDASWNFGLGNTWNRNHEYNGGYPYLTFALHHTVTADITPENSGTITWLGAYPHGTRAMLTVTPAAGYSIASVSGCEGNLDGNTFTTGPIIKACTVEANFSLNNYTITFDSAGGSAVADITQDFGTTVTPPANPTREGYTFAGWNPSLPASMPAGGASLTA